MEPQEISRSGHRVVDLLAGIFEQSREAGFPNVTGKLTQALAEACPQDPSSSDKVLGELKEASRFAHMSGTQVHGLITPSQIQSALLRISSARLSTKHRGLYDCPPRGHGATNRALAYRPGRYNDRLWQPHSGE